MGDISVLDLDTRCLSQIDRIVSRQVTRLLECIESGFKTQNQVLERLIDEVRKASTCHDQNGNSLYSRFSILEKNLGEQQEADAQSSATWTTNPDAVHYTPSTSEDSSDTTKISSKTRTARRDSQHESQFPNSLLSDLAASVEELRKTQRTQKDSSLELREALALIQDPDVTKCFSLGDIALLMETMVDSPTSLFLLVTCEGVEAKKMYLIRLAAYKRR